MRRRLGAAGSARAELKGMLRRHLGDDDAPVEIGLDAHDLEGALPAQEAEALTAGLPLRGDAERLREIVWWGSALADLPQPTSPAERNAVLGEAGRFNLAVALFDSVLDDFPRALDALVEALAPDALRRRLVAPGDADPVLQTDDAALQPLVGLFDTVLAAAGTRLREQPRRVERLAELLETMLRSELGLAPDPFLAKTLPVVFIGELVDPSAETTRLFRALAEFLWLWDDWLDLSDDLRHLRPNAFLGRRREWPFGAVAIGGRGAVRVVAGPRAHGAVASRLDDTFRHTLVAARLADRGTYRRTLAFNRALLS